MRTGSSPASDLRRRSRGTSFASLAAQLAERVRWLSETAGPEAALTVVSGLGTLRLAQLNGHRSASLDDFPAEFHAILDALGWTDDLGDLPSLALGDIGDDELHGALRDFQRRRPCEDPLLHLFEQILACHDARGRRRWGVYTTPRPVADFVVRSIDRVLRERLGVADGLGSTCTWRELGHAPLGVDRDTPAIQILDPAAGTGTFLLAVIDHVQNAMLTKWRREVASADAAEARWRRWAPHHLLPRLHGIEVMAAPCAVAHLRLKLRLRDLGCPPSAIDLRRANALTESAPVPGISVVLGNPPYASNSANLSPAARALVEPYRHVEGQPIRERGAIVLERALQDDCVKFFAVAQRWLSSVPLGAVGYVASSAHLHSPTLRGMRASLRGTFDGIDVVDLHGDARRDPPGDQNLFPVRTGVAVTIAARGGPAGVRRWDVTGTRDEKIRRLAKLDVTGEGSAEIEPSPPVHAFEIIAPFTEQWRSWPSVADVFRVGGVGIKTNRDALVIDFDDAAILERLRLFADSGMSDEEVKHRLGVRDNSQWRVADARPRCQAALDGDHLHDVLCRPFDTRRIFYHPSVVFNPRPTTMRHMLGRPNVALLTVRRIRTPEHAHFFAARGLIMAETLSTTDNCHVFPLYLWENGRQTSAIDPAFIESLAGDIGLRALALGRGDLDESLGPEDVFHALCALFHSSAYRARFADLLRDDFPRVPPIRDRPSFQALCSVGERLVALQLMEGVAPDLGVILGGDGPARIDRGFPRFEAGRIRISRDRWIEGINAGTWEHRVGTHQVCRQWLTARRERALGQDDLRELARVVGALRGVADLLSRLDDSAALNEWDHRRASPPDCRTGSAWKPRARRPICWP